MRRALVSLLAVLGVFVMPSGHAAARATLPSQKCGTLDLPETGLQGDVPRADQSSGRAIEGYNCGVALVGHTDLGARGLNANMAWAGTCAYVAGEGNGIAVVDVADPVHPRWVSTLHGQGSDLSIETLNAFQSADRAVLVAGRYGPAPVPVPAPVDIYDVRDCTHPKRTSTFTFPNNVHNFTFSPDGRRVYATLPLQVLDITDLAHPRFVGKLEDQIPQPALLGKYLAHEVLTSPDGNVLYLGGQTPTFSWFTIVDITGWPARRPKVLSQVEGRGHSIRMATMGGRRYVLHSEESIVNPTAKGCISQTLNPFAGVSEPWLSDVTDPAHPIMRVSQFHLQINDPANCLAELSSGVNASVHYHDVDNASQTTFAMLSMWNAGLRIVDIRDPLRPREVAYFNPGAYRNLVGGVTLDQAWGHIHYDAATGRIWFATATGGFWVVELEPQARRALGLAPRPTAFPDGAPARPAATRATIATPRPAATEYYCTLGIAGAAIRNL